MSHKEKLLEESLSMLEKIEVQMEALLTKKMSEMERELERKIENMRQDGKEKMSQIAKELKEERVSIADYHSLLTEFSSTRESIKTHIQEHLKKVIQYQSEIGKLIGQTLEEFKNLRELHGKLDAADEELAVKVQNLKKEFEGKVRVEAPEVEEAVEEEDLDSELSRLRKIKELLEGEEWQKKEKSEEKEVRKEGPSPAEVEDKGFISKEELEDDEARERSNMKEEPQTIPEEEFIAKEEEKTSEPPGDSSGSTLEELSGLLEEHRRDLTPEDNGRVRCFVNEGQVVLDGENIISEICEKVEEAKKIFLRLSEVESSRERFFMEQNIALCQESLRKFLTSCIKISDRDGGSFPTLTSDILNENVIKEIIHKINTATWTDEKDYEAFNQYAAQLKKDYFERISPRYKYLESIIKELGIGADKEN